MLTTAATWILTLATIAQAGGGSTTKTWKKVAPDGGDFQVMMPGVPKTQTRDIPTPNMGDLKLHSVLFDSKARAYSIMYSDYPADAIFNIPVTLKGARDGALNSLPGAKAIEDNEIELNGVPGLEVKAEVPPRGGNPVGIFHLRLYFVKNRLYQVVTMGPKDDKNTAEIERFFKSFKLLGDHAKPEGKEGAAPKNGANAEAEAGGWKRFSPKSGDFVATFPGIPTEKLTSKAVPNGQIKISQYLIESKGMAFLISSNDLAPNPDFDVQAVLKSARDGSMKAMNVTDTIEDREIDLGDVPGREFACRLPAKGPRAEMIYRARLYGKMEKLYQVVVVAPADSADSPDVKRFLDSFRLTDGNAKEDPAAGADAPKTWKPFAPEEGMFRVSLPAEPVKAEQTVKAGNIDIKMIRYTIDRGRIAYIVAYNDYPPAERDENRVLNGARDGAVAATPGARLVDDKELKLGNVPGREFTMHVDASKGIPEAIMRSRIYLKGNRLYQTLAVREAGVDEPADFERFLSSFEILDGQKRPAAPGARRPIPSPR